MPATLRLEDWRYTKDWRWQRDPSEPRVIMLEKREQPTPTTPKAA